MDSTPTIQSREHAHKEGGGRVQGYRSALSLQKSAWEGGGVRRPGAGGIPPPPLFRIPYEHPCLYRFLRSGTLFLGTARHSQAAGNLVGIFISE